MLRLALSYAFATSVKLDTLEVAIEGTIQATQHIPEELAAKGKIDLSKQEISKYIGELYIQKSAVNLTGDLLDSPDWLWVSSSSAACLPAGHSAHNTGQTSLGRLLYQNSTVFTD
eukprot:m.264356 g.264356  ORF g.264356 m.264356 type:complete len:115 (-) comp17622_c0_seq6:6229-6573(-)